MWISADHDHYYTLPYIRKNFAGFRTDGGVGEYHEFEDIPGNGHALFGYISRWQGIVAAYLRQVDGG